VTNETTTNGRTTTSVTDEQQGQVDNQHLELLDNTEAVNTMTLNDTNCQSYCSIECAFIDI